MIFGKGMPWIWLRLRTVVGDSGRWGVEIAGFLAISKSA